MGERDEYRKLWGDTRPLNPAVPRLGRADVREIFEGSNGDRTAALYRQIEALGPKGVIAVNIFRACKTSERAKAYRGGAGFTVRNRRGNKFAQMAYERKDWSIDMLAKTLADRAGDAGITSWGWGLDAKAIGFEHVLYVDLPTGQVSFHTRARGEGPDYSKPWDPHSATREKIIAWIEELIEERTEA